jgi:hypothetical protein
VPQATENIEEIAEEVAITQSTNEEAQISSQEQVDIVESLVNEEPIAQALNQGNPTIQSNELVNGSLSSELGVGIGQTELGIAETQIPGTEIAQVQSVEVAPVETDAFLESISQTPIRQAEDRQEAREDISQEITPELAEESVGIVQIEAPAQNDRQNQQPDQASGNMTTGTSGFAELPGLIGVRARASSEWLQNIANKNAYTVQMAAFPIGDQPMLEEYLQLLSLTELLDETYLCLISRRPNRPQQWLVIHGEFIGVSRARDYIESLPIYSRQYEPFARNSDTIACLSDVPEGSLFAF